MQNFLENAILVTADFVGLYPSVPHKNGSRAPKETLDYRESKNLS